MPDVEPLGVLVATVAAFVAGATYDAVLGEQLAAARGAAAVVGSPSPRVLVAELLRCLVLAAVVAGLAAQGEVEAWGGGALLGLALWVGFPFVLWTGAVLHEGTPVRLAVVHAGDWLLKLLLVAVIASLWI